MMKRTSNSHDIGLVNKSVLGLHSNCFLVATRVFLNNRSNGTLVVSKEELYTLGSTKLVKVKARIRAAHKAAQRVQNSLVRAGVLAVRDRKLEELGSPAFRFSTLSVFRVALDKLGLADAIAFHVCQSLLF